MTFAAIGLHRFPISMWVAKAGGKLHLWES